MNTVIARFKDETKLDSVMREIEKKIPRRLIALDYKPKKISSQSLDPIEQQGKIYVHPEEQLLGYGSIAAVIGFIAASIVTFALTLKSFSTLTIILTSFSAGVFFWFVSAMFFARRIAHHHRKLENSEIIVSVKTRTVKERNRIISLIGFHCPVELKYI